MDYLKKVLKLTAGTGEELLRCGAEISRVEETMSRISKHYGMNRSQIFVIANGIFVNLEMGQDSKNVSIEHIPQISVDLNKLCELNNLSREIEQTDMDIDRALERFREIKEGKKRNPWERILASGIGAAAFCLLFGGAASDCIAALGTGLFIWAYFTYLERFQISKVLLHISGALLIALACVALSNLGLVEHLDKTIMGSIIPMIPGVAFVNGIRDLVDGDYLSGAIRLLDAVLIFICIAVGVYLALYLGGGFWNAIRN